MSRYTREFIWWVAGPSLLVAGFLLLLVAGQAKAQDAPSDIVVRPTSASATWTAGAGEGGVTPVSICLFACGDDYLDTANHVDCTAVGTISGPSGEEITGATGDVSNPFGAGDACWRAVAISATGAISEPSPNSLTVLDLPLPPTMLSVP